MRRLLGIVAGALFAALGAVILGEYEFKGITPVVAGILFGLIIAEVMTVAGRTSDLTTALVAAVFSAAGMVWAAWISSGRDWDYVPGGAWVGMVLAALAAAAWIKTPGRRGSRTPKEP